MASKAISTIGKYAAKKIGNKTFDKAIQKISDTEKSYATFEGIKTQNEELKISLLKESEKFVDTKDVLNKYTSPLKKIY